MRDKNFATSWGLMPEPRCSDSWNPFRKKTASNKSKQRLVTDSPPPTATNRPDKCHPLRQIIPLVRSTTISPHMHQPRKLHCALASVQRKGSFSIVYRETDLQPRKFYRGVFLRSGQPEGSPLHRNVYGFDDSFSLLEVEIHVVEEASAAGPQYEAGSMTSMYRAT